MSVSTAADGIKDVTTPLTDADVESLKSGDRVRISGKSLIGPPSGLPSERGFEPRGAGAGRGRLDPPLDPFGGKPVVDPILHAKIGDALNVGIEFLQSSVHRRGRRRDTVERYHDDRGGAIMTCFGSCKTPGSDAWDSKLRRSG